jgi:aminocarboxymuconate-semialdehyde decarboxylase
MFFDSLVHDRGALKFLLDLVGPDRVCLGSDYPFPLGEERPGTLIERTIESDDVKAKLLHRSALDWLDMAGPVEDEA